MTTALVSLTTQLAKRLDIGADGAELVTILKATAFKGPATDAQMTALMVVANQYGLNPWTKEIYAFPDKNNGIVPVVGVDGWARIINEHPQFDGMDFEQDDNQCTCRMYRKDRGHPIAVDDYNEMQIMDVRITRGSGPAFDITSWLMSASIDSLKEEAWEKFPSKTEIEAERADHQYQEYRDQRAECEA